MSLNVVITGATGFLGRRLIARLAEEDVRLTCLVRAASDPRALLDFLPPEHRNRVEFAQADLGNRRSLEDHLDGADIVYHLAAALAGSTSTMFLNSVVTTRRLAEAAATAQVKRFVLVSSVGVYGTAKIRRGGILDEQTPLDPYPERRDAYTFSKICQEQAAWEAYERWGLPLTVVRPGVIYGPGRSILTSRVGLSVGPLLIQLGGTHPLPYTFVENCADAVALAGLVPGIDGEAVNVVDDDLPTGSQVVRLLRRNGQRIRRLWVPSRAIGPLASLYEWYSEWSEGQLPPVLTHYKSQAIWKPVRYSNAKARRQLHWAPRVSTEDALQRTIAG